MATTDDSVAVYALRAVRDDDALALLDAFSSAPDMARQGEVTDLEERESLSRPDESTLGTTNAQGWHHEHR